MNTSTFCAAISAKRASVAVILLAVAGLFLLESCGGMNGKYIEPPQGPRGLCSLIVNNNFDDDIVVKLADVKNPTVCLHYVYVSAGSEATISGIAPGNLMMRYSKGREWDKAKKMFLHDRANYESDEVFKFEETETKTETSDGIQTQKQWSVFTYTLNADGKKGNSTTSKIDDKEFNGGK